MSAIQLTLDSSNSNSEAGSHGSHSVPGDVESDTLRRVADLSLAVTLMPEPHGLDEAQSSPTTGFASTFASRSPPISFASGSVTSFDFERNSDGTATHSSDELSSLSPAPSLYSLTDSLREGSTRVEYGREVNTHSEIYKLAADEDEVDRMDLQHFIYKRMMGDYVPPLREVLADNGDLLNPKTCLDVGCGSGAWILEVARDFPRAQCTAVDLVPLPAVARIPANLRFEIDDVNLGLEHFAGDFNVVHVRHTSTGIKDYYRLIDDTALALRPHGLADFTECNFRMYDINKRPITPTTREIWGQFEPPDGWTGTGMARSGESPARRVPMAPARAPSPFLARFITLAGQAARKRGGHVDAAALLHRWISEHPAYEDVVHREFWLPCAAWMREKEILLFPEFGRMSSEELEKLCCTGVELGKDTIEFMKSLRPLLLSTGVPQPLVDILEVNASREIQEAHIPMYFRIQNVYARKKDRRQVPTPGLPTA